MRPVEFTDEFIRTAIASGSIVPPIEARRRRRAPWSPLAWGTLACVALLFIWWVL